MTPDPIDHHLDKILSAPTREDQRTAMAEAMAAGGWQPIETADTGDERVLLGIVRQGRLEEIHIGFFSWGINEDEGPCWWSEQNDDEIYPDVWMPFVALPPPPAEGIP